MSDFPQSDFDEAPVSPETEEPKYTEVGEARKAHRRLFTLGLLSLILAIIAFFFPRCDFDDDDFGAGSGLTDEQLIALIEENCVIPGVTGPSGADGEAGADGGSGATGEPGQDGEDGRPGAQGSAGEDGATGATGEQGPAGETGATGAQGEQGICGPIGATGPAGPQGEPGPAGIQGEPGAQGIQGVQGVAGPIGPAGPRGATGPVGPPGTGGLGGFGAFWDQCTQYSASGNAVPMQFSHSESFNDGVRIVDADGEQCPGGGVSSGGSPIQFREPGIYNVQFSAQYTTLGGGGEAFIEVWIRKDGVDVPWTNTHFYTVANSLRLVALVNWFVPVTCDSEWDCDSYEIMWRAKPKNDVDPEDLILVADSVADPAIPSIILTVNQVG